MDSMDRYYNMSMVDVAYELMTKKKTAVNFYKLWNEVCQMKKFDEEKRNEKESLFYTNITFSEVHIDMNDIYAEEEDVPEEPEEDVDSTIEDDYN